MPANYKPQCLLRVTLDEPFDGFGRDREQGLRLLVERVQILPDGAERLVGRHNEAPEILLLVPDLNQATLEVDLAGPDAYHFGDPQSDGQAQADEGVVAHGVDLV